MLGQYILEGRIPVLCKDLEQLADFWNNTDRHLGNDNINEINISTVFLSIDHAYGENAPPLLFETMIFGGLFDESQWRYETYDAAEKGHKRAINLVKFGLMKMNKQQKIITFFKWLFLQCRIKFFKEEVLFFEDATFKGYFDEAHREYAAEAESDPHLRESLLRHIDHPH